MLFGKPAQRFSTYLGGIHTPVSGRHSSGWDFQGRECRLASCLELCQGFTNATCLNLGFRVKP